MREQERESQAGRPSGLVVRRASPQDAQALLAIYRPYVEETAVSFEWEAPTAAEFSQRIARTLEQRPYLVAERRGKPVGYAYAGAFKERRAYDWAVETTVYVKRTERRCGVGGALYQALEAVSARLGVTNLNACVACPKTDDDPRLSRDSLRFHERMGFSPTGRFHDCGFKFGRWYDMVWFEKPIGAHPKDPRPVTRFSELSDAELARVIARAGGQEPAPRAAGEEGGL